MEVDTSVESPARHFLDCIAHSRHRTAPFDHWLLEDALPASTLDAIAALPVPPPGVAVFDGTREANNSARLFFSPQNQARHAVCQSVADAFRDPDVVGALEYETGAPVTRGALRIEYCQDVNGFWLEPHVDIAVKLFTMLIYLSDDPALRDAGTDIYDSTPEHRPAGTVPYEKGRGLIFIPGRDTWHGFTPRPIRGVRKSIIVNYVSSDWRAVHELA